MNTIHKTSFINSLATLVYISGVAWLMKNGEQVFGKINDLLGPIAFLLLFTLSALVVGSLIIGKPIMLYIDGQKKEAVQMLLASILWLALFTAVTLILVTVL